VAVAVVDSVAVEVPVLVVLVVAIAAAVAEEVESVQYWSVAAAFAVAAVDSQSAGRAPRFVEHSAVLPRTFAVVAVVVAAAVETKRYSLQSHLAEQN